MLKNSTTLIRKLYDLAKPYGRKKLAIVFAVIVVQGLFQVVGVTSIFPFLALASDPGQVRDSEIGASILAALPEMTDRTLLIAAGCFAILMLFLSNGLLLLGEVVRVRYAQGLGHWLRLRLLTRITSNPYSYFLQHNSGELLKKTVTDVSQMIQYVLLPLLDATSRILTVLLLLTTLIIIEPIIATATATLLIGFYALIFGVLKKNRDEFSDKYKSANRGAMREAQQLLGGIKAIKIHNYETGFIKRYAKHSRMQAILQKWFPIYQNTPRYMIEPLAFGGIVVIVLVLATRGESFVDFMPKFGVMALAGYRLLPNLQLVYGSATQITLMTHTIEEVHEEFESNTNQNIQTISNKKHNPKSWHRSIKIEEITFRYPNSKKENLRDLNLIINKNEFIAIVGTTGSGKSTLVDLILGLHSPISGKILIDDMPLNNDSLLSWRASIGYVPQDIFLLDDTIAANIAFGYENNQIDMERVIAASKIAQIAEFIESELPEMYNSKVGERGMRLSGGQRQRIGLARALYHRPSTLILDEATSALDNDTEKTLMDAIETLHGDITLIVIAHRLTTIERADSIYHLKNGQLTRLNNITEIQEN